MKSELTPRKLFYLAVIVVQAALLYVQVDLRWPSDEEPDCVSVTLQAQDTAPSNVGVGPHSSGGFGPPTDLVLVDCD